jgi:hypothetical protein
MFVGLAPGQTQKSVWSATGGAGSTVRIAVKTSDINFNVGAFYYVILNSADSRVDVQVTLRQQRMVTQLQSGI